MDTTTPLADFHSNAEMNAIGYAIALGVLVVALPLLPIFLVYLVVDRAAAALGLGDDDIEPGID